MPARDGRRDDLRGLCERHSADRSLKAPKASTLSNRKLFRGARQDNHRLSDCAAFVF
jgi:hypothetical protein